jgi:TPR repeat protein
MSRHYLLSDDYSSAEKWARRAIEQNNTHAKLILALCIGRQGSYNSAFELMTEVAEADFDDAQYVLGTFYEDGEWGRKSINTAISWYKKAAEHGNSSAIEKLKELGVE